MACKSIQCSSSSQMACKYDVFVSFRGEDTRKNFTDHLFAALKNKGILAFRDDTKLKKGKSIAPELLQAIEGSRVFLVVFSKNYASSTWCLRELAKILDCIQASEKRVLPIFYDVDPSDVRKQSGRYEQAFAQREKKFKQDLEMMMEVQRWREALKEVGNISGWDVRNKPQSAEIEKIVKEIISILDQKISSLPNDLVGIESLVEKLENLSHLSSVDDVRVVGISGMGGIGKTTLATALYDRYSHQYDGCCFIDDISKIYTDYGPIGVAERLLSQTLNEEHLRISNLCGAANLMRRRLRNVKSFIVLDNVSQTEQLEKLAPNRAYLNEMLGAGSKVIIISRDEHILKEYGVDVVYNVQLLNYDDAFKLFCTKAFKCDEMPRDYIELTFDALKYANGLPLAIKVLGSSLFGRDVSEWRSALAKLKEYPSKDVFDVLRVSFEGLDDMEKEIFLDIACFFSFQYETYVKNILDIRGFYPKIGIRVLRDKCLITIEEEVIKMHDLLQELGRSIVREKSPKEPRKWSRLWDYEDLQNVMLQNMAAENLEAIVLERLDEIDEIPEITMRADALSKMSNLKLLILQDVNFSGSLNYLSNELGYLCWKDYPFDCLPSSFQPDKLVELKLQYSSIEQLWEGKKSLHNLRHMDLSYSRKLIKMPDFRQFPNLEWLELEGCIKLEQIDPSIGILKKLAFLSLRDCKNLVSIPNTIFGLSSLEYLHFSGCSKLYYNWLLGEPRHAEHLEKLDINESAIQCPSTSSIFKILLFPLHFFYGRIHEDSVGLLLPSLPHLPCLRYLDLSFCNLLQIPDAIGGLHCLESLDLGGNNFVRLPSFKELSKLTYLNLQHCKQLKYLPELPSCTVLTERTKAKSYLYSTGLYIFDCPNLSEREHCQNKVFSWMLQFLKVNMQSPFPFKETGVVIPGSGIPRWFNNQNVGGQISMDPYSVMHDENWIGVACCAAYVPHHPWEFTIGFRFIYKKRWSMDTYFPILPEKDVVRVESDHLFLSFLNRELLIDNLFPLRSDITKGTDFIRMISLIPTQKGLPWKVKNCGYRWVFKEDLEQLNPKTMHFPERMFLTND